MVKTIKIGRNADNGKFVPVEQARSHKRTYVVETIKKVVNTKKKNA